MQRRDFSDDPHGPVGEGFEVGRVDAGGGFVGHVVFGEVGGGVRAGGVRGFGRTREVGEGGGEEVVGGVRGTGLDWI